MALIDYGEAARTYDAARGIEAAGLEAYRELLAGLLPRCPGLPVLDLGAGTGQWSRLLRDWFGRRVIAVEPSAAMRTEFRKAERTAGFALVAGAAEWLPLASASCGLGWLSTVVHHFADLDRAASELGRVIAPGGRVLIRGVFAGTEPAVTTFRLFSEALRVLERYPTIDRVQQAFGSAGFALEAAMRVPQTTAPNLVAARERVLAGRIADTVLRSLTDAEFAAGLARIDREIAAGRDAEPVVDALDVLVFVRE